MQCRGKDKMVSLTSVWQILMPVNKKHLLASAILQKHEKEKKRAHNSRIMDVEHGTFTPLVFPLTGGEGP